jgi:Restriction endonuclease NotI
MIIRPKKDLVEVFGYAPDDMTTQCRSLWNLSACPFVNKQCSKANHDGSIIYGTCSVSSPYGDCVICPNRFYEKKYAVLRAIAEDSFGKDHEFLMYEEYIPVRGELKNYIVALGQNSGKEVKIGKSLSMDWVLVKITNGKLVEYTGVEVQSIDITGNYRDSWHSYKNLTEGDCTIPASEHGMNWANVHKRLIPQIIRKGAVPLVDTRGKDVLTIHTYELSPFVKHGEQRSMVMKRNIRFSLEEFSQRFIAGPNLPSGEQLDNAVMRVLGLS